mgnify:CR=1 FL=1
MSPGPLSPRVGDRGFPRVSGDEPTSYPAREVDQTFSPRERG